MKGKLIFTAVTALLLVPWTVAYAYDDAAAATGPVAVTSPGADSLPQFNVYGNAIGGITPGDIFLIDSSESTKDNTYTLYITNTDELIHNFRYMTLNIGTYVQNSTGGWEKIPAGESDDSEKTYLTMRNGAASFVLAGGAKYKITIERGCFYCYNVSDESKIALPDFYLTIG